ncbi:MAG: hypothetical protein KC933_16745 [Myxococcales bacterium]|nr:hypothetical protein [Myxococcales bacterium]MCB9650076.1 hypothetical protein [Deltaproteobacteria bacterium]
MLENALKILFLSVLTTACTIDDPCGPDLVLDEAVAGCVAKPVDAGFPDAAVDAGTTEDAGDLDGAVVDAGDAPDAGEVDSGVCADPGYGDVCTSTGASPECACEADFCALQPGSATGFCTRTHCLPPDPGCPAGYTCMDLSAIAPEVGSICVP